MSERWVVKTHKINLFNEEEINLLDYYMSSLDPSFMDSNYNLRNVEKTGVGKTRSKPIQHLHNKIEEYTDANIKTSYFLKYKIGSYAKKHIDHNTDITVITMLSEPDSCLGGDIIADGNLIKLKRGETIFYTKDTYHQVTEVLKGERRVYVNWCSF